MDLSVYTISQLAEILQVSNKTAYRLVKDKEIQAVRVRGQIRIPSRALEEYLEGGFGDETKNTRELV